MSNKAGRTTTLLTVGATCLFLWFIPNFVRWRLHIPDSSDDGVTQIWVRYCSIMLALSTSWELFLPASATLSDAKRLTFLAVIGGSLSAWLTIRYFPHPSNWDWAFVLFWFVFCGGVASITGTLIGASYRTPR